MITKLFIWWHRRRAQRHHALALEVWHDFGYAGEKLAHESWKAWHLAEIERLQKS